jgi:hypothetical protein
VAIGLPKPGRPRDPAIRDEMLIADLRTVHQQNFFRLRGQEVAMRRRGWQIGRELTGRLMRGCRAGPTRQAGVHHHRRPGRGHTGGSGGSPLHPTGCGWRTSPNGTCAGSRYTAFVTDAATKAIVGWAGGGHDAHRGSAVAGVQSCGVASGFRSIRVGASFRPRFVPTAGDTPAATPALPLPKTAVGALAVPATADRATASQADPPNPTRSVVPHHNSSPSRYCDGRLNEN